MATIHVSSKAQKERTAAITAAVNNGSLRADKRLPAAPLHEQYPGLIPPKPATPGASFLKFWRGDWWVVELSGQQWKTWKANGTTTKKVFNSRAAIRAFFNPLPDPPSAPVAVKPQTPSVPPAAMAWVRLSAVAAWKIWGNGLIISSGLDRRSNNALNTPPAGVFDNWPAMPAQKPVEAPESAELPTADKEAIAQCKTLVALYLGASVKTPSKNEYYDLVKGRIKNHSAYMECLNEWRRGRKKKTGEVTAVITEKVASSSPPVQTTADEIETVIQEVIAELKPEKQYGEDAVKLFTALEKRAINWAKSDKRPFVGQAYILQQDGIAVMLSTLKGKDGIQVMTVLDNKAHVTVSMEDLAKWITGKTDDLTDLPEVYPPMITGAMRELARKGMPQGRYTHLTPDRQVVAERVPGDKIAVYHKYMPDVKVPFAKDYGTQIVLLPQYDRAVEELWKKGVVRIAKITNDDPFGEAAA